MKRLLMILFINFTVSVFAWTPAPEERAENNAIMLRIAQINEEAAAHGMAHSSPARKTAVYQYLKNIGTPTAMRVLQDQIASDELPNNFSLNNPSGKACKEKNPVIAESKGIKAEADNQLLSMILSNKNEELERLINTGANIHVTYQGQSLVIHALKFGNIKAALLLIRKGADFSWPVKTISQFHGQNIVTYILNRFSIKQDGVLELIQEIINKGFSLTGSNDLTSIWDTAICCSKGYDEVLIKFLVKNGANPNQIIAYDKQIWTPLLIAVNHLNVSAAKVLIELGADVNKSGIPLWHGSHTPVSYAMLKADSAMTKYLLENGAKL